MAQEDDFKQELMSSFQAELEEHLSAMNKGLLALEQNPSPEARTNLLYDLFRAAHSLKGAARTVSMKDIETLAHTLEDALGTLLNEQLELTPQHADAILTIVDAIRDAMAAYLREERLPNEESLTNTCISDLSERLITVMQGTEKPISEAEMLTQHQQPELKPNVNQPHTIHINLAPKNIQPSPKLDIQTSSPSDVSVPSTRSVHIEDTIRVSTSKLDSLMDSLGELLVARIRAGQMLDQVQTIQARMAGWQKTWRNAKPTFGRFCRQGGQIATSDLMQLMEFLENNETNLNAFDLELKSLVRRLVSDRNNLQLVTDDLETGIRNARMLPIATLFDYFPRMVRDLARAQSKKISLQIEGADTEVDRQILESMKDPLTHLLRNAIDHGIELPDQRSASGKPRQGIILLKAEQRGSNLVLEISDDGAGIDIDAVKQVATKGGLLSVNEAENLKEQDVLELIFHPGLSTTKQVSDISGRGVGMDVVHKNLEQLHGLIRVNTQRGLGTTYTITLPLTLSTSHILLLRSAGETVGLPILNVERILGVSIDRIGSINGQPAIYTEGQPMPLITLAQVLNLPTEERPLSKDAKIPVVVMGVVDKRVALRVDSFISTQEVVIKNLGRQLQRVRNIAGVTILGDGQPVVILNAVELMKSIHEATPVSIATPILTQKFHHRHILVTDDSITTRLLEKHILENAGYLVSVAAGGQEAWELIRSNQAELPDLVVSDINMPDMDGFTLTQAIKDDPHTTKIPVVLITSMESPMDKIRGLEVGADAYIVKSSFDQRELLETINRLIG